MVFSHGCKQLTLVFVSIYCRVTGEMKDHAVVGECDFLSPRPSSDFIFQFSHPFNFVSVCEREGKIQKIWILKNTHTLKSQFRFVFCRTRSEIRFDSSIGRYARPGCFLRNETENVKMSGKIWSHIVHSFLDEQFQFPGRPYYISYTRLRSPMNAAQLSKPMYFVFAQASFRNGTNWYVISTVGK